MKQRVAIIGCGRIAGGFNHKSEKMILTHALAYQAHGADIVGCSDIVTSKAKKFATRWEIPFYTNNTNKLLKATNPQVVSICVPSKYSAPIIQDCLNHASVTSLLIEKPFGVNLRQAQHLKKIIKRTNKSVIINYFRAFDAFYIELEKLHRDGKFGNIMKVVIHYSGFAIENASHFLERMISMLGNPKSQFRNPTHSRNPTFTVSFKNIDCLFINHKDTKYSDFEINLYYKDNKIRILDTLGKCETFQAVQDPNFPSYYILSRKSLLKVTQPDHQSLSVVVKNALFQTKQSKKNRELLERAFLCTKLFDEMKIV